MKKIFLILICLWFSFLTYGQDQIICKSGKIIQCRITAIDTVKIDFYLLKPKDNVKTYVNISKVHSFTYKAKTFNTEDLTKSELGSFMRRDYDKGYLYVDSVENSHKHFVYTFTNEIIPGNNIEYKTPFLRAPYIEVDAVRYDLGRVKFYKNETGFYANAMNLYYTGSPTFAHRVKKGRINLYEKITEGHYYGSFPSATGVGMTPMFAPPAVFNYYNKGFGDLKKANYKNLLFDLSDNEESMIHLEKIKSQNTTQTILYIIGGASLIGGFATLISKTSETDGTSDEPEPNVTGSIIAIGAGASCFWISYFISLSKPKHLRRAIEAYNK